MRTVLIGLMLSGLCVRVCAGATYTAVRVDPAKEHLELFLNDDDGRPFNQFERLKTYLSARGQRLRFAMNAGMFRPDYSPVGLLTIDGNQIGTLKLGHGFGNFYLKPNGVFVLLPSGPKVIESSRYPRLGRQVILATQSGPLLVENGKLNPAFNPRSQSRFIRNGVGVFGSLAIFLISDQPVTFYEFATYFRDSMHCPDALYFDGHVSGLFTAEPSRSDLTVNLGPMVGVVE